MSSSRDGRSRDPRRPGSSPRPGRGPAPRERPARPRGGEGRRAPRETPPPRRPRSGPPPRRPGGGPPGPPPRRPLRRGNPRRRLRAAGVLMTVVLLVFAGRLVQIQAFQASQYAAKAEELRLTTIDIPTTRGAVTDASGSPLALSVEARTVFVDPVTVQDDERDRVIDELTERFDLDRAEVAAKVGAEPSRYEVVAEKVPPKQWEDLQDLGLAGVGALTDYKRVYPDETGAADIVGFTGADGHGLEGLEAVMEDTLAGEPGKQRVEVGASGVQIPMAGGLVQEPVPGKDVRLTLDRDIQWHASQVLAERAEELEAQGGSAIVMRPTGEILAMADYPTYDQSDYADASAGARLNGAVAEAFEPGSTNKVITVAGALEEGLTTPETVYTVPYSMRIHDRTFSDSHFHKTQRLTLNGIMAQSSNVGTIKVGQELGAQRLYRYLRKFGFGEPTGLDLPGENAGILAKPEDWWGTQLPSISFGQGLSVNAAQMASVYATVANGGVRVEPTIVAGTSSDEGGFTPSPEPPRERVISKETAKELTRMLEAVTGEHGTAEAAQIPNYRVAGKTGTANRVDPETGTYNGGHTSMFVGFAPADDPELVVQVVLHDPKHEYYGGEAAAPVFTDIMSFALKSEKVPPTGTEPPNIRLFGDG
ncbi:penicillin-binding protein 2 [Streptomonospora sp. PA3]|uniref:peptidoglycan D,D-transpeptidase FtsI family protein n=1 Tax=Streptomonospora sp. PA3 TaxID=2607326 RepID=UPI0012DF3C35|nr:penicillin-binding protein 2 [Streptomonospora sp. PA3]MUL40844.1 penicillin-binding protein 2 [Streptomonospora sp. PA3]